MTTHQQEIADILSQEGQNPQQKEIIVSQVQSQS